MSGSNASLAAPVVWVARRGVVLVAIAPAEDRAGELGHVRSPFGVPARCWWWHTSPRAEGVTCELEQPDAIFMLYAHTRPPRTICPVPLVSEGVPIGIAGR